MVVEKMNELRGKLLLDVENIARHQQITTNREMAMLQEVYTCFRNLRQILLDASKENQSQNLFQFGLNLSRVVVETGGMDHEKIPADRQGINTKMGSGLCGGSDHSIKTGGENISSNERKVVAL